MMWRKNVSESFEYVHVLMLFLAVLLSITSLVSNRPLLLLPAGFLVVWIISVRQMNKHIGKKLELKNPKQTIRLFEGEAASLKMTFNNEAFLPYMGASVSFSTSSKISGDMAANGNRKNTFRVPLSIPGHRQVEIGIPFQAMERGVTRISDIRLQFPHLLSFQNVSLAATFLYGTEILIYPKPFPVQGIETFPYAKLGEESARFSPFEDQVNLLGTKDYEQTDPFNRIHWKASAKNQTLQTKVFARQIHISWKIIINVAVKSPLGNSYWTKNLEKHLSYATYLAQMITKQGHPVEVSLNIKNAGNKSYHLEAGTGKAHLKKVLEFLARVDNGERIMDIGQLLHETDQQSEANLVVMVGQVDEEAYRYISKWKREGRKVFHVEEADETAYLQEIQGERSLEHVASE